MANKKLLKYFYALFGITAIVVCSVFFRYRNAYDSTRSLTGMLVISVLGDTYLITDNILTQIDIDNIKIYYKNKTDLKTGDIVTAKYKGLILESNPQQILDICDIVLNEPGQLEDIVVYQPLLERYNIKYK